MAFSRFRYRSTPGERSDEPRIATPNYSGLLRVRMREERKERKRKAKEEKRRLKEERKKMKEEQRRLKRGGMPGHLGNGGS